MKKIVSFAFALLIAVGAQATSYLVDLSTLTADFTAPGNGDVTTFTGQLNGRSQPYKISIADGGTVILDGADIDGSRAENCEWAGITCLGDATIKLEGRNSVFAFHPDYSGIFVPVGKTLSIQGPGFLHVEALEDDVVKAPIAAAIGAGYGKSAGDIIIKSGTIEAIGASGIGAATEASCGDITILDGNITATALYYSAGIGAGDHNISNTGENADCGNITISGGTIFATGDFLGAGIGSGSFSTCGNITISRGIRTSAPTVTAVGGVDAAGIGTGYVGHCGNITISDVNRVTAVKGEKYSGNDVISAIGTGNSWGVEYQSTCGDITLDEVPCPDGILISPWFYPQAPEYNVDKGWMFYDNGQVVSPFGPNEHPFWWAVMYPAYTVESTELFKIGFYITAFDDMPITIYVVSGGASPAAGGLIYQAMVEPQGFEGLYIFDLPEPVEFDNTKNLWIVLHAASGYPATICDNTGDPNSRWYSMDNFAWGDLADTYAGGQQNNYSFMVRAYFEENAPEEEAVENVSASATRCQKILRNGHILIRRGTQTYTLQGQPLQ